MTTLYISEFNRQARDGSLNPAPIVNISTGVNSSQLSYTPAASVQSSDLLPSTLIIRVLATSNCYISVSSNPIADATGIFLQADMPEYFGVDVAHGNTVKLAVKGA